MFAGGERRMNPRERMMHRQRAHEDARGDLQRYTRDISNMTAANHRGQNIGGRIRANQSAIRATESMFADQRRAVRHLTLCPYTACVRTAALRCASHCNACVVPRHCLRCAGRPRCARGRVSFQSVDTVRARL